MRALNNEEGRITDKYRYNAYGELIERSGETENHYLYTGEYYDGTSNLYYLRARYMNPSTGTFISMDTYEGSIYDPDTLHKYLYANGNPVKYSDPTGNFFSGIGSFMATTIQTTINNAAMLNVLGVISGVACSAVTTFLGGNPEDAMFAFVAGYIGGFGMGAILCVAAAYSAAIYATMLLAISFTDGIMVSAAMVYSIIEKKEKETIVCAVVLIVSLISLYQAYNLYGTIVVTGDKGSFTVGLNNSNLDEPAFNGKKIGGSDTGNSAKPSLKFGKDDLVYGPSAGGKLAELQKSAGGKLLSDTGGPYDRNCDSWLSYSKLIMDETVANGNTIHFDLTYMSDIDGVLNNVGPYANSIKAGELRYIRDNWSRFDGFVKFYNNGEEVLPPWMK